MEQNLDDDETRKVAQTLGPDLVPQIKLGAVGIALRAGQLSSLAEILHWEWRARGQIGRQYEQQVYRATFSSRPNPNPLTLALIPNPNPNP